MFLEYGRARLAVLAYNNESVNYSQGVWVLRAAYSRRHSNHHQCRLLRNGGGGKEQHPGNSPADAHSAAANDPFLSNGLGVENTALSWSPGLFKVLAGMINLRLRKLWYKSWAGGTKNCILYRIKNEMKGLSKTSQICARNVSKPSGSYKPLDYFNIREEWNYIRLCRSTPIWSSKQWRWKSRSNHFSSYSQGPRCGLSDVLARLATSFCLSNGSQKFRPDSLTQSTAAKASISLLNEYGAWFQARRRSGWWNVCWPWDTCLGDDWIPQYDATAG